MKKYLLTLALGIILPITVLAHEESGELYAYGEYPMYSHNPYFFEQPNFNATQYNGGTINYQNYTTINHHENLQRGNDAQRHDFFSPSPFMFSSRFEEGEDTFEPFPFNGGRSGGFPFSPFHRFDEDEYEFEPFPFGGFW